MFNDNIVAAERQRQPRPEIMAEVHRQQRDLLMTQVAFLEGVLMEHREALGKTKGQLGEVTEERDRLRTVVAARGVSDGSQPSEMPSPPAAGPAPPAVLDVEEREAAHATDGADGGDGSTLRP